MTDQQRQLTTDLGRTLAKRELLQSRLQMVAKVGAKALATATRAFFVDPTKPFDSAKLAKEVGVSKNELSDATSTALTLVGNAMLTEDAEPFAAVLDDLRMSGKIDDDLHDQVLRVLETFAKEGKSVVLATNKRLDAARLVRSSHPYLEDMRTRCMLVPEFIPEYSVRDSPDSYTADVPRTIPSVIVRLEIDSFGESEQVSFAVTELDLSLLIRRLQLAQKQLKLIVHRSGMSE